MDVVIKQKHERVNAVIHQPPHAPMYEESYFEEDACFVNDHIGGFHTNAQGSNQDYWRQGQGN